MNFFAENLQVFKRVFFPLFALVVLSSNIDQYLNLHIENALRDPGGVQQQVLFYGFFAILSSVLFPVLLVAFCLYGLNNLVVWKETLEDFLKKFLNQMYIETMRAWGKTLLWSLVLILPGLWKYTEYILVPFVVTSSPRYDQGKEDALEMSAYVVKHNLGKISLVLFFFHLFIPMIIATFFDSYRLIWKTPIASLALSALDTYLLLVSTHLLFNIFKREVRKHDAHV